MARHDARDDAGQYRTLSPEEAHGAALRDILIDRFGPRSRPDPNPGPPAPNPAPPVGTVLGGGPRTDAFAHEHVLDDGREAFLDGLFPNRPTGAGMKPYSLTDPRAPLYRQPR